MWLENELLKMMQANHEIFGDEILEIESAKDEWLIKYFEKKLYKMLEPFTLLSSKYSKTELDGWGRSYSKSNYKKFNLTATQCIRLFEFIYPNHYIKNDKVCLNKWDSQIILNYIDKGYSLDCYKLVYTGKEVNQDEQS